MTLLEALAAALALGAVWLQWREHVGSWWLVFASAALYSVVFWHAHLTWEAVLQGVFMLLAVRGICSWAGWCRLPVPKIHELGRSSHLLLVITALAFVPPLAAITVSLRATSWSVASVDAALFSFSVLAVWLTERKVISCWWYWLVIDVIAAVLYASRGLYITSALYALYVPMATGGYRAWLRR